VKKIHYWAILAIFLLSACATSKKSAKEESAVNLDPIEIKANLYPIYNSSKTRKIDLKHTKLNVKFDWDKAHLLGEATITLSPYFYSTSNVALDAKGFDIHEVKLASHGDKPTLEYEYEDDILNITLDRSYTKNEKLTIFIKYTAKPNELDVKGSSAIKDAKGLYFINHDGKDGDKPKQIWTQGETESNSCWFPTIDKPNERMTQEMYITVDTNYVTLSNGLLIYSQDNGDGTRTDYWKQELPHAPYLFMMSIGEYAIVKDQWRDIEVNYYVEPEYEKHAKMIYGATPEMLQFYSDKLGVEYPWEKYSQVVVRDYVSGAMENSSAVIFGEFMQRDEREYLDRTGEDIIAHEVFHHWFGDLVTCESWSNLPLNESFATYGEYLWMEYKHGRDEGDYHIAEDLDNYLWSSTKKQVDIIRFNYEDKEDMFDSHSYAKGSRVLHMLRKLVGDEAFFAALKLYLERHKFTSVEIHQLRLAFEEVTGEDLNWFFNQWFLNSGHPMLLINYEYNDSLKQTSVTIIQSQDLRTIPLYRIPLEVDIYVNGKAERHHIVVDSLSNTFEFNVAAKPDLVNVDAEKMLLGTKKDYKTKDEWVYQYEHAPLYLDRYEAVQELKKFPKDEKALHTLTSALNDKHRNIVIEAMAGLKSAADQDQYHIKEKLIDLAGSAEKSEVRSYAIRHLASYYHPDSVGENDKNLIEVYKTAITDRSYMVIGSALSALGETEHEFAFEVIESFDKKTKEKTLLKIAEIYGKHGSEDVNDFFLDNYEDLNSYEKYSFLEIYADYLMRQNDTIINKGLALLADAAENQEAWWSRLTTIYRIRKISAMYQGRIDKVEKDILANKKDESKVKELSKELRALSAQQEKVENILKELKEKETDKKVLQFWDGLAQ